MEAAPVLEQASAQSSADLLGRSSSSIIAGALQRMAPTPAAEVLTRLPANRKFETLAQLSVGTAALLLRSLDPAQRARLLEGVPEETARSLRTALFHPEGSAGSVMDSNVVVFPQEISVGEARRRARRKSTTGNYAYVVDAQRKLVGAVSLRELMHASPSAELTSLMRSPVVQLPAQAGVGGILNHAGWRELHAIPVVDSEGVLVGVLRRETYERLRAERADQGAEGTGGVGLALAELVWAAMVSTVDGFARAASPESSQRSKERGDEA